jgi:subtilisin family serine protease
MLIRHTLAAALLTALAGAAAPYDAAAATFAATATPKADERVPFYIRHAAGRRNEVEAALRGQQGEITYYLDRLDTFVVNLPAPAAESLSRMPDMPLVERVPEHKLAAQVVPWNIDQFQARDVWDKNRDGVVDQGAPDGSGITICIIDTGFHLGHSDFAGVSVNGTTEGNVGNWFEDGDGHGTHVAGTINAVNNTRGVVGVLPGGAELYIVKVFNNTGGWGGGSLAAAANKCRLGGADVISMSLGGGASQTEENMFQDLYDNYGILNVAAAGNDGNDVPSAPAMYESVVMVGAINEEEVAAEFSQTPPTSLDPSNLPANVEWDMVEFTGGGVQVLSTVPTPDGEVPNFSVTANGTTHYGSRVAADAPEETPEGNVSGPVVDGGRCLAGSGNAGWANAVVLCERGDATFAVKINEVRARNGRAAIIYNNVPGDFGATCGTDCIQPSIPSIALSQSKGQALLADALGDSANVVVDDGAPCVGCEGGYDFYSGTSMATPGVSAGMAFVWNACGGPAAITNKQLRQLLRDTAKDLSGVQPFDPAAVGGAEGPGDEIPYGIGYDRVTGWGIPQLADALELGNARFGTTCPLALTAAPAAIDVCTLTDDSTAFQLTLDDQFTGTSTLGVGGVPAGASGAFSPNPVQHPATTSTFTLNALSAAAAGNYALDFTAVDIGNPNNLGTASVSLTLTDTLPAASVATSPANGAIGVSTLPTLNWQAAAAATGYLVQVATDAGFSNIVHTANVTGTSHTVNAMLASDTQHFWRVIPSNGCGTAAPAVASFRTGLMFCAAPGIAIPDRTGGPNGAGVSSTINVPITGTVADVDIAVMVSHSWVGDLQARLTRGAQSNYFVFDRPGGVNCSASSIDATLDDEAGSAIGAACPPVGTFTPTNPLSVFDGTAVGGNWTLNLRDQASSDVGTFDAWCVIPTLTGGGGNAAPAFQGDPYAFNIAEAAAVSTVVGDTNATDPDAGQTLNFSITGGNTGSAFSIDAASGEIRVATSAAVVPANSPFTLQLLVTDGFSGVDTATAAITVTPSGGNAAPVAVADSLSVNEGGTATTLTGGNTSVRQNDTDAEDGVPSGDVVLGTGPVNGSLTLNTNGTFSYTHNGGETTSDSFTYTVRDSAGVVSNAATVSINVVAQNDAPVAVADSLSVNEGGTATTLTGGNTSVRQNDTDAEDGVPSGNVVLGTAPVNGSLTLNNNGTFSYTHNGGETTSDSFTYTVRDSAGAVSNIATVSITVVAQNDAPVAVADSLSVNEGGTATTLTGGNTSVRQNDTDAEDGVPTGNVVLGTGPVNGSLTLNTNGTFSYTHNGSETTSDSFTYTVRDSAGAVSNVATVSITVVAQNDAPVANSQSVNTDEDTAVAITLTASDAENDSLQDWTVISGPSNGSLSGTAPALTYTPNANYNGGDSFTFTVGDGSATSNTATVTITVAAQNDAPVAVADAFSVNEGGTATTLTGGNASVRQNDTDAEDGVPSGDVVLGAGPVNGSLTLNTNGTFSYTHNGGETTSDSFTYTVRDSAGAVSNAATVSIAVVAQNDAPVANSQSVDTNEDTAVAITLTASDAEGGPFVGWSVVSGPANGTLSGTAPNLSYTPDADFNGADSFTFTVGDGSATSNTATVTITVAAVNDAPTFTAEPYAFLVIEGSAAGTAVGSVTSTDVDGGAAVYAITGGNNGGAFQIDASSGAITVATPASVTLANSAFQLQVSVDDGAGGTDTSTVTITVQEAAPLDPDIFEDGFEGDS